MLKILTDRIKKSPEATLVLLLMVVAFALLFNLGGWGVTESSEARYAEISYEMFQSGDWLHPRLLGIQHFHKPPVVYWLTALAYHLFGPTAFAARFFLQIAVLIQLWLIFHLSVLLFNDKKTALMAALIYTSFIGVVLSTRALTTDAFLNTFVLASIFFWARSRGTDEWGWLYAAWFCLGMGFMTKGPVVFIVPVVVFPAMNSLWPSRRRGFSWHHVGAIALFLLTAVPWYVFLLAENRAFLDYFVIDHTVNRFATNQFKRGEPFWFFLAVLPFLTFPWLLLSLGRIKRFFKSPFHGAHLLGLWVGVPLLFFSLSSSKLVLYILPIFPAVAIWAAHSWAGMMKKNQIRWNITLLVYHAVLLVAIVLAPLFVKEIMAYGFPIWGMALVMGGLVVYQWLNMAKPLKGVWVAAFFSLSLTILSSFFLGANPGLSNDTKDVAELVKTLLPPDGKIMVFNKRLPSLAFETQQMTLSINDGDSGLNRETQFESDQSWQQYLIDADSLLLKKHDFFVGSVLVAKKKQKENPRLKSLSQHYKKVEVVNDWHVFYDVAE